MPDQFLVLCLGVVLGLVLAALVNTWPWRRSSRRAPGREARQRSAAVVRTGRLGRCPDCGAVDGCLQTCPTLDPNNPNTYHPFTECVYEVDAEVGSLSAFFDLCSRASVSVADVSKLNDGKVPTEFWRVGNRVSLPYGVCRLVDDAKEKK